MITVNEILSKRYMSKFVSDELENDISKMKKYTEWKTGTYRGYDMMRSLKLVIEGNLNKCKHIKSLTIGQKDCELYQHFESLLAIRTVKKTESQIIIDLQNLPYFFSPCALFYVTINFDMMDYDDVKIYFISEIITLDCDQHNLILNNKIMQNINNSHQKLIHESVRKAMTFNEQNLMQYEVCYIGFSYKVVDSSGNDVFFTDEDSSFIDEDSNIGGTSTSFNLPSA